MTRVWRAHLPEYASEALALGIFMVSACGFSVLLFHPLSPLLEAVPSGLARRALMGLAMALTFVGNVYSPWGRRSGTHMNPAVTLTFWRLGKVSRPDLVGYIAGQFIGGLAGTALAALLFMPWIADPAVNYAVTVPGASVPAALLAELALAGLMMFTVRTISSHQRLTHYTGLFAAGLVAAYITFESPISGMSLNPARTVGSAALANVWTAWWIYFLAPTIGMALGALLHRRLSSRDACAKLLHDGRYRCIFCQHSLDVSRG